MFLFNISRRNSYAPVNAEEWSSFFLSIIQCFIQSPFHSFTVSFIIFHRWATVFQFSLFCCCCWQQSFTVVATLFLTSSSCFTNYRLLVFPPLSNIKPELPFCPCLYSLPPLQPRVFAFTSALYRCFSSSSLFILLIVLLSLLIVLSKSFSSRFFSFFCSFVILYLYFHFTVFLNSLVCPLSFDCSLPLSLPPLSVSYSSPLSYLPLRLLSLLLIFPSISLFFFTVSLACYLIRPGNGHVWRHFDHP